MSRAGAEQAEPEVRVSECEKCGEEFEHEHGFEERTYCSQECHLAVMKAELQETKCKTCGEKFTHSPYYDRTYCSIPCANATHQIQKPAEEGDEPIVLSEVYEALEGHGNRFKATRLLLAAGYKTEEALRQTNPHDLLAIKGVGRGTVSQLCRNLDYPWVTPFKRGPNPPENGTAPTPKSDEEPVTASTDKEYEPEDESSVKVCCFCKELVPEEKYAVHVRQCDEA